MPWLGLPAEKVASLGVYCEDSQEELWRRQEEINSDCGIEMAALRDVHWMPRLGEDNLTMVFARNGVGEFTKFHGEILTAALDFRAGHVSIDTAADTFGGSEIDRNHVRQYVSRARGSIAQKINGSVMVCAHPSVFGLTTGEGTSGSTGWNNSFRSRLFFRAPDAEKGEPADQDARILDRKKANYAARNEQVKLRWRNGVIDTEAPVTPGATAVGSRAARDVFLDLLDEFDRMKRPASDNAKAGNYAPRMFGKLPRDQRRDYREADFHRAMESLFRSRVIEIIEYGKPSDMRKTIGRSA
jgi:RecA-family ATPase